MADASTAFACAHVRVAERVISGDEELKEAAERERCASFCAKAIAADIGERLTRVVEQQGAAIAEVLRPVMGDPALGSPISNGLIYRVRSGGRWRSPWRWRGDDRWRWGSLS